VVAAAPCSGRVALATALTVGLGTGLSALRHRRALLRTAVSAVRAGLPVVPGAWWSASGNRFDCDLPGCARSGPHPAVRPDQGDRSDPLNLGNLAQQAVREPQEVIARWGQQPYAVLVPTGESCDVIDVPARFGARLAERLDARSMLGPLIAAGPRWFFLTAPGGSAGAPGGEVLVHGLGSWIMLPPSAGPAGQQAAWLARPGRAGWSLPLRDDVIGVLAGRGVTPIS
jgi:hypothetical protein